LCSILSLLFNSTLSNKAYKNLAKAAATGLRQIFEEHKYADQVIEKLLSSDSRFGARDRRFLAETLYNIVRYWRHISVLEQLAGIPDNSDYFLKICLWLMVNDYDLSEWEEVSHLNAAALTDNYKQAQMPRAVKYAIPDWLDEVGETELGSRWEQELASLNTETHTYIRANTLKIEAPALLEVLQTEGVECSLVEGIPTAIRLEQRTNVIRLGSFRKGLYEVQDASSQLVAPFLGAEPGETIIDACAGAGGKTLHLGAMMQGKGKIIGMDVEGWKLEELKKRASRAGLKNVETQVIATRRNIKRLEETADKLLLDVPCSGLGVVRRNPDTKWKLSPESLDTVRATQYEILDIYTKMLKPGGKLVYATCSILPSEDEEQVQHFLDEHRHWELLEEKRAWPSNGGDGFYMASLLKKK
jgi:16S rRNA (cytosine967-C5)-methyltransferase